MIHAMVMNHFMIHAMVMFAMFVHEPAERMLLLSMKLATFSLMRVQVFTLGVGTRQ